MASTLIHTFGSAFKGKKLILEVWTESCSTRGKERCCQKEQEGSRFRQGSLSLSLLCLLLHISPLYGHRRRRRRRRLLLFNLKRVESRSSRQGPLQPIPRTHASEGGEEAYAKARGFFAMKSCIFFGDSFSVGITFFKKKDL